MPKICINTCSFGFFQVFFSIVHCLNKTVGKNKTYSVFFQVQSKGTLEMWFQITFLSYLTLSPCIPSILSTQISVLTVFRWYQVMFFSPVLFHLFILPTKFSPLVLSKSCSVFFLSFLFSFSLSFFTSLYLFFSSWL